MASTRPAVTRRALIAIGVVLLVTAGFMVLKLWERAERPIMCLIPPCPELGWHLPWLAVAMFLAVVGGAAITVGAIVTRRTPDR